MQARVEDASIARAGEFLRKGDLAQALAIIDHGLTADPARPELHFARGDVLAGWGRHREALVSYLRAQSLASRMPELRLRTGWAFISAHRFQDAADYFREALSRAPDSWELQFGFGSALQGMGRNAEALRVFERVLAQHPHNLLARFHACDCQMALGDYGRAEAIVRSALELDDRNAAAWERLGVALSHQDRYDEALPAFDAAQRLSLGSEDGGDAFVNIAVALGEVGKTREAIDVLARELPRNPSLNAHLQFGTALLTEGRFQDGWRQYEFRFFQEPYASTRQNFGRPVWNGQDLHGKTVMLYPEQGLGDVVQFLRYAPLLKACGATVMFYPRPGFERLAAAVPGIDTVIRDGDALPEFDYYIPMLSLPRVFGTTLDTIPAKVPYLHPDAGLVEQWSRRIAGTSGLKVGLAWAGNPKHRRDRQRSLSLQELAAILNVAGASFFSLQKGTGENDAPPGAAQMTRLGPDLGDMADTTAVISLLDLVICADTAVAHVAGALGKPVWVMVSHPADFRWLTERDDSPWYPTLRLFRQKTRGIWSDVIERVAAELQHACNHKRVPALARAEDASVRTSGLPTDAATAAMDDASRHAIAMAAEARFGLFQYLPEDVPIGPSIEHYGEYLQRELEALLRFVRPGMTILEAGADIGTHAAPLARAIGENGHLILYENDPVKRRVLRHNMGFNCPSNFTIINRRLVGERPAGTGDDLPADTIDALGLARLDWLKLNSGAATPAIIRAASESIWRLRPGISLSARDHADVSALAEAVKSLSYRCWKMESALFDTGNFSRRTEDIFHGRTACGLLALPEEIAVEAALADFSEI